MGRQKCRCASARAMAEVLIGGLAAALCASAMASVRAEGEEVVRAQPPALHVAEDGENGWTNSVFRLDVDKLAPLLHTFQTNKKLTERQIEGLDFQGSASDDESALLPLCAVASPRDTQNAFAKTFPLPQLKYKEEVRNEPLCHVALSSKEVATLRTAIMRSLVYRVTLGIEPALPQTQSELQRSLGFIGQVSRRDHLVHSLDKARARLFGAGRDSAGGEHNASERVFVYRHLVIHIQRTRNMTLALVVHGGRPLELPALALDVVAPALELDLTYSVQWSELPDNAIRRYHILSEAQAVGNKIAWFREKRRKLKRARGSRMSALRNAALSVLMLVTVVSAALRRRIRRDLLTFSGGPGGSLGGNDYVLMQQKISMDEAGSTDGALRDSIEFAGRGVSGSGLEGWRAVRSELFRSPPHASILCALVGAGVHFIVLALAYPILATSSSAALHKSHQRAPVALLMAWAASAAAGTAMSMRLASAFGVRRWARVSFVTTAFMLLPAGLLCATFLAADVRLYSHTLTAVLQCVLQLIVLGALTLLAVFCSAIACRRLNVLGAGSSAPSAPAQAVTGSLASAFPRPVPSTVWYRTRWALAQLGALFPFACIVIEWRYVVGSLAHALIELRLGEALDGALLGESAQHEIFELVAVSLSVFLLSATLLALVTVIVVYIQLGGEDYRWHWTATACGAGVGELLFAFGLVFAIEHARDSSVAHCVHTVLVVALTASTLSLAYAAAGFLSAKAFVGYLDASQKRD